MCSGNDVGPALCFDGGQPIAGCNLFWDNSGGNSVGYALEPDDILADPKFSDPAMGTSSSWILLFELYGQEPDGTNAKRTDIKLDWACAGGGRTVDVIENIVLKGTTTGSTWTLGLHASKILALEIDDIRWDLGEVVVRGKGRLPRPSAPR
jgi:hypothetical protein